MTKEEIDNEYIRVATKLKDISNTKEYNKEFSKEMKALDEKIEETVDNIVDSINEVRKIKIISKPDQNIAKKLLQWQAQYQKDNPKASLRNVKRAAKKHFKIK